MSLSGEYPESVIASGQQILYERDDLAVCQKGKPNNQQTICFSFPSSSIKSSHREASEGATADPGWGIPWFFPMIMVYQAALSLCAAFWNLCDARLAREAARSLARLPTLFGQEWHGSGRRLEDRDSILLIGSSCRLSAPCAEYHDRRLCPQEGRVGGALGRRCSNALWPAASSGTFLGSSVEGAGTEGSRPS